MRNRLRYYKLRYYKLRYYKLRYYRRNLKTYFKQVNIYV